MTTSITRSREVIQVTGVLDIVVTDIASDGEGGFVRKLLIYGSAGVAPVLPALEVVVKGAAAADIKVTTPEIDF